MIRELTFVTANPHKAEEVALLARQKINIKSLVDLGFTDDIPETGFTFKENASQKSNYIFKKFGTACFGDDSGLEVDALNGEPGIYSARYSGSRDAEANLQLVLDKLAGVINRKARFVTIISLIIEGKEFFFEGIAEGSITTEKAGVKGFGYDPVFRPDGYDLTFAEMNLKEKNRISHRAKAVEQLVAFIGNY